MNNDVTQIGQIAQLFEFHKIAIFILGIALLVFLAKTFSKVSAEIIRKIPSKRLLILQISTILIFLIYIIGSITIFYSSLKPSKELLLTLGGSVAVAVGLSLKDLVSSLVSGLVLLFDQPFQVGDRVQFGNDYGEIRSIGLRAVRLVTLDDNVVTIPNSRFLTEVVACANDGAMDMMVVSDFHIAIDSDINLAKEIINEILITSKYIYLKKPFSIVVSEQVLHNIIAINLKVKSYVLDVKYEKPFQSEIVSKVIAGLQKHNIKRPTLSA